MSHIILLLKKEEDIFGYLNNKSKISRKKKSNQIKVNAFYERMYINQEMN